MSCEGHGVSHMTLGCSPDSFLTFCGQDGIVESCPSQEYRGMVVTDTTKDYKLGHAEGDTVPLPKLSW